MEVTSLGFRTDLGLLRLGGSEIEDRGDHIVVRSPHNPRFWWGNFVLLDRPPGAADVSRWLDVFHTEFPQATHVAIGADAQRGTADDMAGFAAAGLSVEVGTVMSAQSVRPPPRPNTEATYRRLSTDEDWDELVELGAAVDSRGADPLYREFLTHRGTTSRKLVAAGHGGWFGAFVGGRLLSSMGLFRAGDGLARFQNVLTHPDARGRGLAGTLVHHVGGFGLDELGVHTLVMVADPEYVAVRVYRSVGFVDGETQLQAEQPPADAG